MPTQLTEIIFSTMADGFFPTFPANWVKASPDTTRILGGYFTRSGTTAAAAKYTIPFATSEIEVSQLLLPSGVNSSSESGVQFLDSSNNGYALLFITSGSNFIVRVKLIVNYVYSTELFTNTFVASGNHGKPIKLRRNRSTGVMSVWLDSAQLGTNFTNNTYDPTFGSVTSMGGNVRSITLTDLAAYAVDSFNGANDIERGQQDVVFATTGLGAITSITTNRTGITFSGIDNTAKTADASDYTEGGLAQVLPISFISTFSDGTNTAQITKTLTIKSTESSIVTANMITSSTDFIGKLISDAGYSVSDGGQIVWPTTTDFTINSDGSYSYDGAGDLELSFWYITPDTGRSYGFNATFAENGDAPSEGSDITMAGITAVGITMTGITAVGL